MYKYTLYKRLIYKIGPKRTTVGELGEKKKTKKHRNSIVSPLFKVLCSAGQVAFGSPSESQHTKCANIYDTRIQKGVTVCIPKA